MKCGPFVSTAGMSFDSHIKGLKFPYNEALVLAVIVIFFVLYNIWKLFSHVDIEGHNFVTMFFSTPY